MKKIGLLMLIGACIAMTGCLEVKSEFFVNPDGSGKVVYETVLKSDGGEMMGQMMGEMMGEMFGGGDVTMTEEKPDPETQLKQNAKNILTQSAGIEVWKDVSCTLTDDGAMIFKGTAYFEDISELEGNENGLSAFPMKREENGNIVIELEMDEMGGGGMPMTPGAAPAPAGNLTEEQINQQVETAKQGYNQMKMMMGPFLSGFKVASTMHMAGAIKEINNFEKIDEHSFRLVVDGEKMMKIMDEMMGDEFFRLFFRNGRQALPPMCGEQAAHQMMAREEHRQKQPR